jgi:hypothetical protein
MNDKADKAFRELQLKSICPHADQWPTEYMHQKTLVVAANEARTFLRDAYVKFDAIEANRDLSPEGKRRQRVELGIAIIVKMQASKTLARAHETIAQVTQRWQDRIDVNIKRPTNPHEEAVQAQIRDRLFNMGDGRMSWLEKNIDDTLISAVVAAPAYVSGLTEAEYQFVKLQLERHAPPEIIEARAFVQKASAEIERGWRAVIARVGERASLTKGPDGTWRDPSMSAAA